ncbi:LysR family transcriptional regulator, partial [Pseudonocardia abyssalis]
MELRHLRCLVAIVETGTFTDAAIELGLSQAAVSRTLASLESELGVRLLNRTSRSVVPTAAGTRVLARARRLLAGADELVRDAVSGLSRLRLGYAWSAMGRHTVTFQRRWPVAAPDVDLRLVRTSSVTGGLAEGACDVAVVRVPVEDHRFDSVVVGRERRLCAVAADDPWARRRSVTLAEIAGRPLLVDRRTGTTTAEMWPQDARPKTVDIHEVDDWLAEIAAGHGVGITAEATAHQYARPGVVYRPVRDAPPIPVH